MVDSLLMRDFFLSSWLLRCEDPTVILNPFLAGLISTFSSDPGLLDFFDLTGLSSAKDS
jgi:hypothetical protein